MPPNKHKEIWGSTCTRCCCGQDAAAGTTMCWCWHGEPRVPAKPSPANPCAASCPQHRAVQRAASHLTSRRGEGEKGKQGWSYTTADSSTAPRAWGQAHFGCKFFPAAFYQWQFCLQCLTYVIIKGNPSLREQAGSQVLPAGVSAHCCPTLSKQVLLCEAAIRSKRVTGELECF